MKIGFSRQLPIDCEIELKPFYEKVTILEKNRPLNPSELTELFSENDVVQCVITDSIDAELLSNAKKLKCLLTYSVGVDHVDKKILKERKIPLVYTPGALTDATADLAWALILGCARRVKLAHQYLEEGKFVGISPTLFLGLELKGATLGIIGMGRIGKAVADRAKGFGMNVISMSSKEPEKLSEILSKADVVSVHCPLNEKTRGLIGQEQLSLMKKDSILINTARGPIVDERSLTEHLRKNSSFQAGLDVFEQEPKVSPELYRLPNALCLPHIGSATVKARTAMARICVDEAIRFAKGEPLLYEYKS